MEFKYTKGNLTFSHEQKFEVVTKQSKEKWQEEIRDQIFLESQGAVDLNQFDPNTTFTQNVKFIKSVYGYYEQLYATHEDELIWAGMAKMAGAPVFAGLSDAQHVRYNPFDGIELTLANLLSLKLADFQRELMSANKSIFEDMGWQHRAYVASGIWALKHVDEKDQSAALRKVDIPAWNRIDEGIRNGANPSQDIVDGNRSLLEREQRDIVQDTYDNLEALRVEFLGFGIASYNDILSMFARNPIPRGMEFAIFNPSGNIRVYADRWGWIAGDEYEGMYQIWVGTSPSKGYDSATRINSSSISLSTRARDYADFPDSVP